MTGTPSEPSKEELQDDLAEGGQKPEPETKEEPPSDEAKEHEERPKKVKKKKAPPPVRTTSKPLARGLAMLVLFGVPAALILFSGRERGGKAAVLPASTKWAVGSEQSIDVTLVTQDRINLACASPEEVAGKHCEFEAENKKSSKGGDDKVSLKPYRLAGTNDPVLIAGLWSEPALKAGLPNDRFVVRCKLKVEGKIKKPGVRWNPTEKFFDEPFDWPMGSVSGCSIVK